MGMFIYRPYLSAGVSGQKQRWDLDRYQKMKFNDLS